MNKEKIVMKKATNYFSEGTKVQLFPNDSQKKIAKILSVDEKQYVFEILELGDVSHYSELKVGDVMVYPLEKVVMKIA